MRHLGDDQPLERAGGRQHDPPVTQLVFGARQELGGGAAFEGALAQPLPQISGGLAVETADAEMATNAQRLLPFRLCPARSVEEQHRCQSELAGEVVDDLDRRMPVVIEKAAVGAKHAELQGKAATMVGAAASGDLGQISGRQAPVPREFVLARVGRHRSRRRVCVILGGRSSDRHSGASAPGRLRDRRVRVACRWRSCRANRGRAGWRVRPACQDCRADSRGRRCDAACVPRPPPASGEHDGRGW